MYGYFIKLERKSKGLTQQQVAQATGISQQALSFYENNINIPNVDICAKLADFYGISIDELIGREIPPRANIQIDQRHNTGKITNQF